MNCLVACALVNLPTYLLYYMKGLRTMSPSRALVSARDLARAIITGVEPRNLTREQLEHDTRSVQHSELKTATPSHYEQHLRR
jgi:hypothetical protein